MKLLSAALTLLLLNGAATQTCPSVDKYTEMALVEGTLTFKYAVVLASNADERSILCARLEGGAGGWMGFGISPTGKMDSGASMRSTGIIGLPGDGTVQKYWLAEDPRVDPMDSEHQTLMGTSIAEAGGIMVMEFTKYLLEDGEYEIFLNGENPFLYVFSTDASLGYHGSNRGTFMLDFGLAPPPAPETPPPAPDSTTPVSSPTPDTPPTPPSGATARNIAGSMVLGACVLAAWFRM
jgi:hypothetical protein